MIELDFRLNTSDIDDALKRGIIDQNQAQSIFSLDLRFRDFCEAYLNFRDQILLRPSKNIFPVSSSVK